MPKLSTHVLDTMHGTPAAGMRGEFVSARGSEQTDTAAKTLSRTNKAAQIRRCSKKAMQFGTYELRYHVAEYYQRLGRQTLANSSTKSAAIRDQRPYGQLTLCHSVSRLGRIPLTAGVDACRLISLSPAAKSSLPECAAARPRHCRGQIVGARTRDLDKNEGTPRCHGKQLFPATIDSHVTSTIPAARIGKGSRRVRPR